MTKLEITAIDGHRHLKLELDDGRTFLTSTITGIWVHNGQRVTSTTEMTCNTALEAMIANL